MTTSLGVDIGGTKIQFCTVDADFVARPLGRTPTALMRRGTKKFADDLAELIRATCPPGVARIGVTLNGVLKGGHVVYSSLMGGNVDFPLDSFLRDQLGLDVTVDDDLHAMGIAEAHLGMGQGLRSFALLNLGTGIGVGVYDDGRIIRGAYAAGLISEQQIYVEELGEYRSLDRTVCGRGLREMYLQLGGEAADGVTIFARARAGEAVAIQVVDLFSRYLGEAMQMISRFYHPGRIVINGSIKRAAGDYLARAEAVYRAGLQRAFQTEIVVSDLEHAAELGTLVASRGGQAA